MTARVPPPKPYTSPLTRHATAFHELGELVQAAMAAYHIPGVAVGVQIGEEQYTAGFGVTNMRHPLPVDSATLFQVGSITKTITATLLLRLADAGRVDLDVPLRTYLPGLRLADESVAAGVTLRHVLTHTGGWAGDFFDDCGPGDDALARIVERLAELPQLTPLGTLWAYNNAGFYLAGRVVEVVTGQTYEAACQDWVLKPLGMRHSFFFAEDCIPHRVAVGHDAVFEDKEPPISLPWPLARTANAVGGLVCGVDDLLRYARFHLGDGAAESGEWLLAAPTLAAMHAPQVPAANGEHMALTWFVREIDGVRCLRHGGATNGQAATLWLVPDRRFALAVLTNSDRGDELHMAASAWALEHFIDLRPEPLPSLSLPPERLAEYPGRYRAQAADVIIEAGPEGLVLQVVPKGGFPRADSPPGPTPPPVRLGFCGDDQIVGLDEPMRGNRGEFLRDAAGRLQWLRIGGRLYAP